MKYLKGPNELNSAFYYKWHSEELKNNLRGNNMPVHIHQSAELILVTKGRLTLSVAGKEYETVGEMQAAMILPFHPHTYKAEADTEYLRCNFAASLIPDFFNTLDNRVGERAVFNTHATTVFQFKKKILEDNRLSLWSIRAFLYSALDDYLSGAGREEDQRLTPADAMEETVMLSTRTARGLDLAAWREAFGVPFEAEREAALARLTQGGFIEISNGVLRLTQEGMELHNAVVLELISAED